MRRNERGRLFSWPWDWQDWPLPQPILNRIGMWEHTANNRVNAVEVQIEPRAEDGEEHLLSEVDLADLSEFASELAQLIQPALPNPVFRTNLKLALVASHQPNTSWRLAFYMGPDTPLQPWQVIATVPVLVGVAALIWRYRQRADPQPSKAA